HHLIAERRERFTHDFLVRERAVDLRRVEEGNPALDGTANEGDRLPAVGGRAEAVAQAHAAQAEGGDLEGLPQGTHLHCHWASRDNVSFATPIAVTALGQPA